MKRVCAVLGLSLLCQIPAESAVSQWRSLGDDSGTTIEARFEGKKDGLYLLRRRTDGKLFEVRPDFLKPVDQTLFDQAAKSLDQELGKLNATASHLLFSGTPFEARPAEEIAKALKLRAESSTKFSKSWRLYASKVGDYRLFGAMPYSVALYADPEGHASSLSVVFANKGDFGSQAESAEDHFKGGTTASNDALGKAMAHDEAAVATALSSVLGEPQTQRFGEGKSRRTIKRWDWNGHSLLLSSEENEYVSLLVVPLDFAEAGGRTAQMKGDLLKKRLAGSVVHDPNGDVYLSQIPMVDQGPKGYCVPATFERAMRTMGIETDMYLLAMLGGTAAGGGTSVERLLESVRSSVYRKGRRTKDDNVRELRIRDVKRYIDEGIPVMWTMKSVEGYNKTANENTAKRKNVTDWPAYTLEIAAKAEEITAGEQPDENHHICMIIGYNETTGELVVSDSWGPSYERRWVPVKVASWASQGSIFMILP
jgi:hypothetical protein